MGDLTTSADTTVIDFVPTIGPDGRAVWTAPEEAVPGDIALADGVLQPLAHADDAGGLVAAPWGSTLPTERMAGGPGPGGREGDRRGQLGGGRPAHAFP